MKVNLIKETTTNSEEQINQIYNIGKIWEKENCIRSGRGLMYLFSTIEGREVFVRWLSTKEIAANISVYDSNLGVVVEIEENPALTKLLLKTI